MGTFFSRVIVVSIIITFVKLSSSRESVRNKFPNLNLYRGNSARAFINPNKIARYASDILYHGALTKNKHSESKNTKNFFRHCERSIYSVTESQHSLV